MTFNIKGINKAKFFTELYNQAEESRVYPSLPEDYRIIDEKKVADMIDEYFIDHYQKFSYLEKISYNLNSLWNDNIKCELVPSICKFFIISTNGMIPIDVSGDKINLDDYIKVNPDVNIDNIISKLSSNESYINNARPKHKEEYKDYFKNQLTDLHHKTDPYFAMVGLNRIKMVERSLIAKCEDHESIIPQGALNMLNDFDLYPWSWNDKSAIVELCGLVESIYKHSHNLDLKEL